MLGGDGASPTKRLVSTSVVLQGAKTVPFPFGSGVDMNSVIMLTNNSSSVSLPVRSSTDTKTTVPFALQLFVKSGSVVRKSLRRLVSVYCENVAVSVASSGEMPSASRTCASRASIIAWSTPVTTGDE